MFLDQPLHSPLAAGHPHGATSSIDRNPGAGDLFPVRDKKVDGAGRTARPPTNRRPPSPGIHTRYAKMRVASSRKLLPASNFRARDEVPPLLFCSAVVERDLKQQRKIGNKRRGGA